MKKVIVLYDDSRKPGQGICDITGKKSFGKTIFKRISLFERTKSVVLESELVSHFYASKDFFEKEMSKLSLNNSIVFVVYSDFVIKNKGEFYLLIEKSCYAKDAYKIVDKNRICALILPNDEAIGAYLNSAFEEMLTIETTAFFDLSMADNFRQYITSGFDARFFNSLSGDDYTVVKSSGNIKKIKAEYEFYRLLPDYMKSWFVLPYDYKETDGKASYTMERYHMTDLAIRYIHGAIDEEEFRIILSKVFSFIEKRLEKSVSFDEYNSNGEELYTNKVDKRIELLKSQQEFQTLENYIISGTKYQGIDDIVAKYKGLYKAITGKKKFKPVLVVSHGDLCFSNILYSQDTSLMRLIDPKGAENENELYMNPYYDIAKLSHSICGNYDFFNSDLFEVCIDDDMKFELKIFADNANFVKIFKEYLEEKGIDFYLVRLYEASLFLSMLPLHIDRQKKTFGFVLNAIKILEELEQYVLGER